MAASKNQGLTYGVVNGLVGILLTVVLYLIGVKAFVSPFAYIAMVIPIVFAVLAAQAQKKAQGGFLEFGEALKTTFTVFVIGTLLGIIFNYVLFNLIDVGFREALAQETAESVAKMMQKFGAKQEDIDKAMTDAQSGNSYSAGKMALGFAFSSIFSFIISLIVSAIVKKSKPAFE